MNKNTVSDANKRNCKELINGFPVEFDTQMDVHDIRVVMERETDIDNQLAPIAKHLVMHPLTFCTVFTPTIIRIAE
jgi:hypothetical protein